MSAIVMPHTRPGSHLQPARIQFNATIAEGSVDCCPTRRFDPRSIDEIDLHAAEAATGDEAMRPAVRGNQPLAVIPGCLGHRMYSQESLTGFRSGRGGYFTIERTGKSATKVAALAGENREEQGKP